MLVPRVGRLDPNRSIHVGEEANVERALGQSHCTTAALSRGHGQGLARKGERPCGQVRDEDSDDKTRDNARVYEKSTTKSFLVTWLRHS